MPLFKKYSFAVWLFIRFEKKNFAASTFILYNRSFFFADLLFSPLFISKGILALFAKYFTASIKGKFFSFITKEITFPASPHPKHL